MELKQSSHNAVAFKLCSEDIFCLIYNVSNICLFYCIAASIKIFRIEMKNHTCVYIIPIIFDISLRKPCNKTKLRFSLILVCHLPQYLLLQAITLTFNRKWLALLTPKTNFSIFVCHHIKAKKFFQSIHISKDF